MWLDEKIGNYEKANNKINPTSKNMLLQIHEQFVLFSVLILSVPGHAMNLWDHGSVPCHGIPARSPCCGGFHIYFLTFYCPGQVRNDGGIRGGLFAGAAAKSGATLHMYPKFTMLCSLKGFSPVRRGW